MMSLELQKLIFEDSLSRRALLNYSPQCEKKYCVQVFRNHSFELVEHTIGAYLDYAGIGISFCYSGYDDSLSFLELNPQAELVMIWIDTTRYVSKSVESFLNERITQLRIQFSGPILLVPFGEEIHPTQTGVTVFNLSEMENHFGAEFIDKRAEPVTGTSLSRRAMMAISRMLGLRYFPALLRPALKAILVDLDNTLYRGVLGEDGINGVVLTKGHRQLQEELKDLSKAGFFLCAVSKNDAEDVEQLLGMRDDFPLRKGDFSKILASWDSKASSIEKIAQFLNIHPDSMVFVDDNIGELTAVKMAFPGIRLVLAGEDGASTCQVLKEFPCLWKINGSDDDVKRKNDVKANEQRQILQKELSAEEYIRSLGIHLKFCFDNMQQLNRIFELANKTNQFIFNYKRYTLAEVEERIRWERYAVVSISLADKLSDSGLIGVCVGRGEEDYAEIEECFISCRALGRGIDDVIVLGAIDGIARRLGKSKVKVLFQRGERNTPAKQFIEQHLEAYLEKPLKFQFEIPKNLLTAEIL